MSLVKNQQMVQTFSSQTPNETLTDSIGSGGMWRCVFIFNFSAGINGVRFPMAFMIFCYGAFNLITTNKTKQIPITTHVSDVSMSNVN